MERGLSPLDPFELFQFSAYAPESYYDAIFRPTGIGECPRGVLRLIGPIALAEYRAIQEPELASAAARTALLGTLLIWKPPAGQPIPKRWTRASWLSEPLHIGYHAVLTQAYAQHWKKSARNALARWKRTKAGLYSIVEVDYGTFADACRQSTLPASVADTELARLLLRQRRAEGAAHLYVARRRRDGAVGAGLAAINDTARRASFYSCGFMLEEMREDGLMTALMDHWFSMSVQQGLRVLHLGLMADPSRARGKPASISRFKEQFTTGSVAYADTYLRFVPGRLFAWASSPAPSVES